MSKDAPSEELLRVCALLGLKQENKFTFIYKGHDVDLSKCDNPRPVFVMKIVADQIAETLTKVYLGQITALFGENRVSHD